MSTIVPRTSTRLSAEEASRLLRDAYTIVAVGRKPSPRVLALLQAHSALETGSWKKMLNFNFGFLKAGPNYPTAFLAKDDCGANECSFRSYPDAGRGAFDYLQVLKNNPEWWAGLHTEDVDAYNRALSTPPKYYSADPAVYGATLKKLFLQFLPPGNELPITPAAPAKSGHGGLILAGLLFAGVLAVRSKKGKYRHA